MTVAIVVCPALAEGPRWFFTPNEGRQRAQYVREMMPDAYQQAIADADEIMAHRFLNSPSPTLVRRVQLGPDFSFMDNPTGDRQFLYVLHRHRYWEELAIAYVLTGDEKYANEFVKQLTKWLDECPLPISDPKVRKHEMWSGLDVGIRAFSWGCAYECFRNSPAMTPKLLARWREHFMSHGEFLRQFHAAPISNWCAMQMKGLLYIGLLLPDLPQADAWREYAHQKLIEAIRTQVRPDGVQVEESPSYHVGCIGWFAEPMVLGTLNGLTWPDDYRATLEKMCDFALWVIEPDGRLAALSDTDRSLRGRPALAAGFALFRRREFIYVAKPTARTVLIYGKEGAASQVWAPPKFDAAPRKRMRHFPDGGYVIMRSGWGPTDSYAIFDCGPHGLWHGHFDLLSLEIHAGGELLLADPGRWWYDKSDLRKEVVSTPAHNTISLDGQNHAAPETNANGEYQIVRAEQRNGWTYVHGRHRAYTEMAGPPVCDRRIAYDGDRTWLVVDDVDAPDPHDVTVSWLFAVDPVARTGPSRVVAASPAGPRLLITWTEQPGLHASLLPATLSRTYGQKEPAVRLRLRQHGEQTRFATVLHVFDGEPPAALTIRRDPGQPDTFLIRGIPGRDALRLTLGEPFSIEPALEH